MLKICVILLFTLGFGREIQLCAGVNGSAGIMSTVKELSIPARTFMISHLDRGF